MTPIVSLDTIDQTLANLNYRSATSMKSRLVQAIRAHYVDEASARTLEVVHAEILIESLWETGNDPHLVNKKRKNLNSVRSSVNVDLQKLFKSGENPDGITINTNNIFVLSDEAKDKALNSILANIPGDIPTSLDQISEILNVINEVLADPTPGLPDNPSDRLKKLSEMKNLVQGLSDQIDQQGSRRSEDGTSEDRATESGTTEDRAAEDREQKTEDGATESGDQWPDAGGQGPGDEGQDTDGGTEIVDEAVDEQIVDLEEEVEEVELLDDDEFEEVVGLGDGTSEGGDQKPEVGSQKSDDGGQGSKDGDQRLEDEASEFGYQRSEVGGQGSDAGGQGSGNEGQDSDEGTETVDEAVDEQIVDLEDDVEEVEVLEDDEFEEMAGLGDGEGPGSDGHQAGDNFGGMGQEDGAQGAEDNHLDAIESGYDSLQPGNPQKARLLAEAFNRSLAAMDKFFNQYIEIPGNDYTIGAEHPEKGETPQYTVSLAPFFIGKFPVTNALFEVFVENTGYITTAEKLGFGIVYEGRCQIIVDPHTNQSKQIWRADIINKTVEGACWYQPSGPGSTIHNKRNHPVVQVSAHDALAFSAWTGKRLPSEEEWEAATRTLQANIFPWGNDMQPNACNFEESSIGNTTPVDNYPDFENNAGIADALGNVLEWAFCPNKAKATGDQSPVYVAKGGSWISDNQPRLCSRLQLDPEMHSNIMGFRCVTS